MARSSYNLRSSVTASATPEPVLRSEPEPADDAAELAEDPFYYGWREFYETLPNGTERLCRMPLTYDDLLDPQEEDFIAENTVHHQMTASVEQILRRRFADDPTVAVWADLKIRFVIPGLTTGPGPDVCVVAGVEDRDRLRRSFGYGEEPGRILLTIEVVSSKSVAKDYRDILEIYSRLEIEEYVAIRPLGEYADGPFELRVWRRDPAEGRLVPIRTDADGRFLVRTCGLLFGTGEDGWGLEIRDAETGERLRSAEEDLENRARLAERARELAEEEKQRYAERARAAKADKARAQQRAEQAEERARVAEEEKERAQRRVEQAEAELERLRAELTGAARPK